MTKRKPKPKLGIEAPLPDYFAPGIAVQKAVDELLNGQDATITIDVAKYNEIAWKLVAHRHNRPKATLEQIRKECDEINKAAWRLLNLFNSASAPTVNALDGTTVDHGGANENARFDFTTARFQIAAIIQASEKAKADTKSGVEPEGLKGRGPDVNDVLDEIGDMIANDYWLLTMKEPGLIRKTVKGAGFDELTGDYVRFFRRIFEATVPGRDFETPARHAARRWKEAHRRSVMEK